MYEVAKQIKEKAHHLDFLEVGICSAEPLDREADFLEQWIGRGFQGNMQWMSRTKKERSNPKSFFPKAKSIIVVADNYFHSQNSVVSSVDEGNISIYARGRDYHKVLRKKLKQLFNFIKELLPEAEGKICVDSFPIMEKPLAVRAGIGWIGKHTNLIIKGKGSYFFLGEILLSEQLPPDEPLTADYCGSCNKCQVSCPTEALNQQYVLDSNKCISYLTIEHDGKIDENLQYEMGNWIFGCDICQAVCPWNNFSRDTNESEYFPRIPHDLLNLDKLIKMKNEDYKLTFEGTPVKRAGYRNFMRNVKIAAKNRNEDGSNLAEMGV